MHGADTPSLRFWQFATDAGYALWDGVLYHDSQHWAADGAEP